MGNYLYKDKFHYTVIDSIEDIKMGFNQVLVKTVLDTTKTKEGLYIDNSFEDIECSPRIVEVVKCPDSLMIKGENNVDDGFIEALDWCTTMELEVGDIAWIYPLQVVMNNNSKSIAFMCGDQLYFKVGYGEFLVAKRGDEVIMLNGNVLLERISKEVECLDYIDSVYTKKSIVRYAGAPNEYYYRRPYHDDQNIQVGCIVSDPLYVTYLESDLYAKFDNGKKYVVCKRKDILYYEKEESMSLEGKHFNIGKVIVERKIREKDENGLFLPDDQRESKTCGIVVGMGPDMIINYTEKGKPIYHTLPGLAIGSKVYFNRHTKEIPIGDKTYVEVDVSNIHMYE